MNKRKRGNFTPDHDGQWMCAPTLTGHACVPYNPTNVAGQEYKTALFDSLADCEKSRCGEQPSLYAMDRDTQSLMWQYLDPQTLRMLSSHDVKSKQMVAEQLAIASLAEELSDTFFLVLEIPPITFSHIVEATPAIERFWSRFSRILLHPENVIELEGGRLAMKIILDTLWEYPDVMKLGKTSLLNMISKDTDALNYIRASWPDSSRGLMWILTGAEPESIAEFERAGLLDWTLSRFTSQIPSFEVADLILLLMDINSDSPRPFNRSVLSAMNERFKDTWKNSVDSPSVAELLLFLIDTKVDYDTLMVALDIARQIYRIPGDPVFLESLASTISNVDSDVSIVDEILSVMVSKLRQHNPLLLQDALHQTSASLPLTTAAANQLPAYSAILPYPESDSDPD